MQAVAAIGRQRVRRPAVAQLHLQQVPGAVVGGFPRVARDFALPQFLVFLLAIKLNMKIIKSKALDDYS
ncbi:hypothetical protein [Cronobacter dublinensis]|uniref:hypothetical protein n=1 Tax=Cronobacter dublinensis TaxID=413497 RepID=UPI0013756B6E|nr:hypothetical protein [Cronobacter dublinensis]NCH72929.1 hypothetical protein [Cronobacter dublinensis]